MKLRYRFLIFTLTLMILTVPVYARAELAVKQDSTSAKLYQKIDPPNSNPVHSIAFATSTEKPTYILGQQNYFLLTTGERQHQRIRLPNLYPGSTVVSAAFSRALKYTLALSSTRGKLLLLYDSLDDEFPKIFELDSTVNTVIYSPDSNILAVGTLKNVSTRNTKDGNLFINQIDIPPGSVKSLVFSPNSRMLAVGRTDSTIELWDVFEHTHLKSLNPRSNYGAQSLAFSPNGELLAVGRVVTGRIELWNVLGEQMQGSFTNEHHGTVHSVAFSPNGKTLASSGADGKVLLWDIQTQAKIDPIQHFKQKHPKFNGTGHGEDTQVLSVAFSDDGKTLMSGDDTGLVLLWDLSTIDIDTGPSINQRIAAKERPEDSKASSQTASGNTQEKQELEITAIAKEVVEIDWDTLLESGTVPTEPLKVVLNDQQMEQEILSTFRAPGPGLQDYTVIEIDATTFEAGGILIIDVLVGTPGVFGSFDLFDGNTELPTEGTPHDALTSAWDVRPNENALLMFPFDQGQTFKLGATGNWFNEKGSINGFFARISIDPIRVAEDMDTDAEVGVERENVDKIAPEITVQYEKEVASGEKSVAISGTVKGDRNGIQSVAIDNTEIEVALKEDFTCDFYELVSLNEGDNTFTITATDKAGDTNSETVKIHRKPSPPIIEVISPQFTETKRDRVEIQVKRDRVEIQVKVTDESDIAEVKCNNELMRYQRAVSGGGIYSASLVHLLQGRNFYRVTARDTKGSAEAIQQLTITVLTDETLVDETLVDETKPTIVLDSRKGDVSEAQTYISGTITDADSGIKRVQISGVQIEDVEIPLDPTGDFRYNVPLNEGDNTFTVTATDEVNNAASKTVKIYRTPIGPHIEVINPPRDRENAAKISTDSFTVTVEVTDESGIRYVKINGTNVLSKDDGRTFSTTLYRSSVSGRVTIEARDSVGGFNSKSFFVNFQRSQQPIDPTPSAGKTDNVNRHTNTPSPTPLNEEEDPPVIQFTKAELIRAQSLKTSDDRFHLIINVADESGIKLVKIDRYATGETFEASKTGTEGIYEADLPLNVGKNMFHITAVDNVPSPNVGTTDFEIVKLPMDTEGPMIESLEADNKPIRSDGVAVTVKEQGIYIRGRVADDKSGVDSVYVNSEKGQMNPNGSFQTYITLNNASNLITVTATDTAGNSSERTFTIRRQIDTEGPTITINRVGTQTVRSTDASITVTEDSILISGSVTDDTSGVNFSSVTVNGDPVTVQQDRSFEAHIFLDDEENPILVEATDTVGNPSRHTFTIRRQIDTEGPTIDLRRIGTQAIHSTDASITVTEEEVVIRGRVKDPSDVYRVEINKENVPVDANGIFEKNISLNYGKNPITVKATDKLENDNTRTFTITQQFDRSGKDFALFFAINKYSGAKDAQGNWQNLLTPISEAEEISESLQINYGFETKVFEDLTKRELLTTLYRYKDDFDGTEYTKDSQLLLFLSGHGYYNPEQEKGYLITANTDAPTVDPTFESALSHVDLRDQIDLIACPRILVLLDTCDSGTFDPDFEPPDIVMKDFLSQLSLLRRIEATLGLEARWCLTASGVGSVADGKGTGTGRSPFAEAFLNALNTNGGADFVLELEEVWKEIEGSKDHPIYEKVIENLKKKGQEFKLPQPRKARFGKKSIPAESGFLFFPKIE